MLGAAVVAGFTVLGGCGASGPSPGPSKETASDVKETPSSNVPRPATAMRPGVPLGIDIPAEGRSAQPGSFAFDASVPSGSGASSPGEAVQIALGALTAGTTEDAFALLRKADRARYGSAAAWETTFANEPLPKSFTIVNVKPGPAEQATVEAAVAFTPGLDAVTGLVPARGTLTFNAVREDGGWRVDWRNRSIAAEYASQDSIVGDVREWADARQSCDRPQYPNENPAGLVGVIGFAGLLCTERGTVEIDDVIMTIDELEDPQPVLDAYGPSSLNWARAVELRSPVAMRVIVAPIGDHWQVIGLLHSRLLS